MTKSVGPIFGSEAKVKIMRLFLFNGDSTYTAKVIAERVKERLPLVRRELNLLTKAGFIKKLKRGYILHSAYPYLEALENFLTEATPVTEKEIVKKISKAGNVRLLLTSGVFERDPEARVDLLVVGDKLKSRRLLSAISALEAQLGRELRYASFETRDFKYRLGVYDKLVRDILDYPHQKLVNKVGL
jgi:hypothetical protein